MGLPIDQVANNGLDNYQNHADYNRIQVIAQQTRDVVRRLAEAKTAFQRVRDETERLYPFVATTVTAAGAAVGFAVSSVLGTSRLTICIVTVGGALSARLFTYFYTRPN